MTELKPCPFCGGEAYLGFVCDEDGPIYFVHCRKCDAQVQDYIKRNAAKKWNVRTEKAVQQ